MLKSLCWSIHLQNSSQSKICRLSDLNLGKTQIDVPPLRLGHTLGVIFDLRDAIRRQVFSSN